MPEIRSNGQKVRCEAGANLRKVLVEANLPLYNGLASALHCRGLGTCGTCAVGIEGNVTAMTRIECWRLGVPPHRRADGLRLACQCKVLGDLQLVKYAGMWGSKLPDRKKPAVEGNQAKQSEWHSMAKYISSMAGSFNRH